MLLLFFVMIMCPMTMNILQVSNLMLMLRQCLILYHNNRRLLLRTLR